MKAVRMISSAVPPPAVGAETALPWAQACDINIPNPKTPKPQNPDVKIKYNSFF